MKIIHTILNTTDEARKLGRALLEKKLANYVNFFPITCIYNYDDKLTEEPEVVLLIMTLKGNFKEIEEVIKASITYDNFIGELTVDQVNTNFEEWLCGLVKKA